MQTPTICPKCHELLVSTIIKLRDGAEVWRKTCSKKIGHEFICITKKGNDDEVSAIGVTLNNDKRTKASWLLENQHLVIYQGESFSMSTNLLYIPWFEPNIEEYDKLVNKVKTYVTFS
jgi:hypothetical protein